MISLSFHYAKRKLVLKRYLLLHIWSSSILRSIFAFKTQDWGVYKKGVPTNSLASGAWFSDQKTEFQEQRLISECQCNGKF